MRAGCQRDLAQTPCNSEILPTQPCQSTSSNSLFVRSSHHLVYTPAFSFRRVLRLHLNSSRRKTVMLHSRTIQAIELAAAPVAVASCQPGTAILPAVMGRDIACEFSHEMPVDFACASHTIRLRPGIRLPEIRTHRCPTTRRRTGPTFRSATWWPVRRWCRSRWLGSCSITLFGTMPGFTIGLTLLGARGRVLHLVRCRQALTAKKPKQPPHEGQRRDRQAAILLGVPVLLAVLGAVPLGLWRGSYQWLCAAVAFGLVVPPGLVTLSVAERMSESRPTVRSRRCCWGRSVRLLVGFGGAVLVFC